MLTENYIDDKITFPKGQFLSVCNELSKQHGQKDVDWFNLFCGKDNENEAMETMHFRHRAETKVCETLDHYDSLDYVIDRGGKVGDFIELYGSKKEYLFVDVKWFVDNCVKK